MSGGQKVLQTSETVERSPYVRNTKATGYFVTELVIWHVAMSSVIPHY